MADDVQSALQAVIRAKVIEAVRSKDEYLETLVRSAFEALVNSHGGRAKGFESDQKKWLEYACENAIRDAAREALKEAVAEKRDEIKAAVAKQLSGEKIASGLADVIIGEASRYYVDVSCTWKRDGDE